MKQTIIISCVAFVTALTQLQADPAENWQKHCAKCHGPDGKGDTKMGKKAGVKDMTTAEYHARVTDDGAFKAIKDGLKEDGKEKMKPHRMLSDQEIQELVAYLRKFKK